MNIVRTKVAVGVLITGTILTVHTNLRCQADRTEFQPSLPTAGIALCLDKESSATVMPNVSNLVKSSPKIIIVNESGNVESIITDNGVEQIQQEVKIESSKEAIDTNIVTEVEEPIQEAVDSNEEAVTNTTSYYRVNDNGCYEVLDYDLQNYLYETCCKYNISDHYELLMAQMFTESGFNSSEISETNDYGLMQINVCNFDWLSESLGITDFLNPYQSIEAGCFMMSGYLNKYSEDTALTAYNMGEGTVKRGIYSSDYSDRVLNNKLKLERIGG